MNINDCPESDKCTDKLERHKLNYIRTSGSLENYIYFCTALLIRLKGGRHVSLLLCVPRSLPVQ